MYIRHHQNTESSVFIKFQGMLCFIFFHFIFPSFTRILTAKLCLVAFLFCRLQKPFQQIRHRVLCLTKIFRKCLRHFQIRVLSHRRLCIRHHRYVRRRMQSKTKNRVYGHKVFPQNARNQNRLCSVRQSQRPFGVPLFVACIGLILPTVLEKSTFICAITSSPYIQILSSRQL